MFLPGPYTDTSGKYLNFDKMDEYVASAKRGQEIAVKLIA
jgi:hypothetical protein